MKGLLKAAVAAVALLWGGATSAQQAIELHGASQFNDDHAFTKAMVRFQELVDKYSGKKNNWVLHKLTDAGVIQRLRRVVSAVSDATWSALPNFAPGQAVCAFTHLQRPIVVSVDPAPGRLRMVD